MPILECPHAARGGRGGYSFLNRRSKALRASSALRGAGGPACTGGAAAERPLLVPSRATVTRGLNRLQVLALSLIAIRPGIGVRRWKRQDGSQPVHCFHDRS